MSTTIKKVISTATIAIVAVGVAVPTSTAQAATAAELQAQINALLAQIQQLQAQLTQGGASATTCTLTRNLFLGVSGEDVKCLQVYLNASGHTVATTGVGSSGNETTFYGAKTKAAVAKWQAANGVSPAVGYFGSLSRAKYSALAGTTPSAPPGPGQPPAPPPITTGTFMVSLAPDNIPASSVVAGQATAPLAKFVFSNGTNAEVKVTNLVMNRIGVSNDSTLSNIFLFDGATRLTDAASVSESKITMSLGAGIFTVPANSSKTVTVMADIATGTSGQTVGVAINAASNITAGSATVTGTFPISSNLHTAATATLATVDYNATTTPAAATTDPVNDYTMWQNVVSIGTRAVNVTRFSLRQIGSVKNTDLQNFRLYADGVQLGTAVANLDSNGYVTFDLTASPKRLETGSRTIQMRGDIIGGSNLNFKFSARNAADATFVDNQFGVNILPTANSSTFSARETGAQTVNAGTVTVSKRADSPASDVVNNANAVTLAKYDVRAAGEPVKIENLILNVDSSDNNVAKLRNGALFVDGVQVGSTADLAEANASTSTTTYNLGSSFIAQPGRTYVLEVKADIFDSDGTNNISAGDTLQISVRTGSSNGFAQVSNTTINVPSGNVAANTATVATGGLTLAKYSGFAAPTYVVPQTNAKLNHFTIAATSTESVNLTDITFDYLTGTAGNVTNVYVKLGTDTLPTKSTISATGNTWSINKNLSPGQSLDLIFYGDVNSSETGTSTFHANMTGTTIGSSTTVYAATGGAVGSRMEGQTITWASSGTFEASKHGSSPLNANLSDNQTTAGGAFRFSAQNDSFTILEMKLRVGASVSNAIKNAILKDGTTVLATKPFNTTDTNALDTVFFQNLTVNVPSNTNKDLTVDLELADVTGTNQAASGTNIQLTMTSLKYSSSSGSVTTDTTPGTGNTNPAVNTLTVLASYPTVSDANPATGGFTNGALHGFHKAKIKANGGTVSMKQLHYVATISDNGTNGTLKIDQFKFYKNGVDITGDVTIRNEPGNSVESTTDSVSETTNFDDLWVIWDASKEDQLASGTEVTYELRGISSGFVAESTGSDSVSFSLSNTVNDGTQRIRQFLALLSTNIYVVNTTAGQTTGNAVDMVWSDNSVTLHNSEHSASGTRDWHNGYLVTELPVAKGWTVQ